MSQVATLTQSVHEVIGHNVKIALVDQGYTGEDAAADVAAQGIQLEVVKPPNAKRDFVLLPRRWVVERSFAWMAKFRRLARDDERLPEIVAALHVVAFACLMLYRIIPLLSQGA